MERGGMRKTLHPARAPRGELSRIVQPALGLLALCALALGLVLFESGSALQRETAPDVAPMASVVSTQPALPQSATRHRHPAIEAAYGKLPLSFEVNQGQSDPDVKFLSRGRGYTLFLTATEAVLSLSSPQSEQRAQRTTPQSAVHNAQSEIRNPQSVVLRMKLASANPSPQVSGLKELPGKSNYFLGNDPAKWSTNVPTYAKVQYKDVYPGVDLVYYGNRRQLEYDLIVAPGTDPAVIQLAFEGEDNLEIDAQGDLVLHTAGEQVRLHKPLVYQQVDGGRREISGAYVLNGGRQVGFQVAAYDADKPLIIDPVLSYSTYLGGIDFDPGNAIAVDASGNAYVTGNTSSFDFPTASPFQPAFGGGNSDAFVTKLNAAGNALVYSTFLGGSGVDQGQDIAVDASGNAYVTGDTTSTDFPTASPIQPAFAGGNSDAFVTKLNAAGNALVYSTYLGGSGEDLGRGIALDTARNAYVRGSTGSTDFPTASPIQPTNGGFFDVFVTKLNAAGSALVYSTYLGGSNGELGLRGGIAVDGSGNAYVTGNTASTDFPTASPIQPARSGGSDAFVTKLNAAGSALVYSTYLGGSIGEDGFAIAVDASGNAYVTGSTSSTDFPTAGPIQPTLSGSSISFEAPVDAFVTKLNAAGNALVYSTYLGGSGEDLGRGIALDTARNAYVRGSTGSTDFPTASPIQPTNGGFFDVFVTKLNAAGSALVYSTYLGGSNGELGLRGGIAVDGSGNAYVTGNTASTDFPTASPIQPARSGGSDAFVTKLNAAGSALVYSTYLGGSIGEDGFAIAVDASGNAYVTGSTSSTDFPTAGPIQPTLSGSSISFEAPVDAFVTKLNAAGNALVYSTYLGGSEREQGSGIAVDTSGNAYVTGETRSLDFPTANAIQPDNAVVSFFSDAFVTKLNAAGTALVYSTYLGGGFNDTGNDIAVDAPGNAYVMGQTRSEDFPTVNAFQSTIGSIGFPDTFIAKITDEPPVGMEPDFTLAVSPPTQSVSAGEAATYTISINASGGFTNPVSLSCTDLPVGASCSFSPNPAPPGSATLTVSTSTTTPAGTFMFAISGVGGGITTGVTAELTVFVGPDFTLAVTPPSQSVTAGASATYTISINAGGGFSDPVSLSCSDLPVGASCSFSPNPSLPGSATLTVSTSTTTPAGTFTFTISGVGGGITIGVTAELTVIVGPIFTLALAPSSQSVTAGGEATYNVLLTASGGFSGAVSLFCTNLPVGASCSFSPNPAEDGAATLTVSTATTTPAGTVIFTVSGTSDSLTQSTAVSLTVVAPDLPTYSAASITNGASFVAGVTSGGIVTIFGTGLTTDVTGIVLAEQLPLPTQLRGTSVTLSGIAAPLFAIANVDGQEQINLQVPYELTGQATATVVVDNNGMSSDPVEVNILPAQPGVFTVDGSTGAILHASDFRLVSPADPAAPGEAVLIYATGLGPVSPAPPTGAPASASPLSLTSITPVVTVGGMVADVLFSGLAPGFVGLYQVNIAVPLSAPSGNLDVVILTGDQVSKAVKIAVQ